MKRIILFILAIMMIAIPGWTADPVKMSAFTTGTTVADTDYLLYLYYTGGQYYNRKITMANLKTVLQPSLSLLKGTLTNTYLCKYTASGTLLDCNVDPAGFQTADADLTAIAALSCTENQIIKRNGAGAWACAADANDGGTPALDDVTDPDAAKTFTLLDNNASALSIGSTGAADILKIITTDASEGITMSKYLTVTGALTATLTGTATGLAGTPNITVGTINAGAGGFTVDADGDVVAKSVTVTQGATGSVWTLLEGSGNGTNFRKISVPDALTADLNLQHADALPAANQFQLYPAPTDGKSVYAWQTYGTFTGFNFILPSSNADPGTTAGTMQHDSTDTASNSGGTAKWYDGAQVRSLVDTGTNYTLITKTEYLPIRYAEDGTTGPAAAAEISTSTAIGRGFDKDADEDVVFWWITPNDYVGGIKYRVIYALGADATADDTAVFSLAGCAAANSATLACTPGTAVTLADELGTDDDQYQVMISDYSTAVTVTDIAAGSLNRLVFLRDVSEDDYTEGDLLVIGIEIKYQAKIIGIGGY